MKIMMAPPSSGRRFDELVGFQAKHHHYFLLRLAADARNTEIAEISFDTQPIAAVGRLHGAPYLHLNAADASAALLKFIDDALYL
jgi:hypothetical protein